MFYAIASACTPPKKGALQHRHPPIIRNSKKNCTNVMAESKLCVNLSGVFSGTSFFLSVLHWLTSDWWHTDIAAAVWSKKTDLQPEEPHSISCWKQSPEPKHALTSQRWEQGMKARTFYIYTPGTVSMPIKSALNINQPRGDEIISLLLSITVYLLTRFNCSHSNQ